MRRIFPGLLMLAALSISGPAQAARPLVFAFDEMLPMKTMDNGSFGGAYTEIVRELARRAKLPLEIKSCPLKRCLFMLEQGEADIIIGLRETQERARYLRFLRTPYRDHSSDRVFYVQKGHGVVIRDYPDLQPLRIGVKLGASYFERFDNDQQLQKDAVKDMEINFRKLSLGRLDAVFIPEDQGEALLSHLRLSDALEKADYRITDATARSIALSRKSPLLAQAENLERAMKDMVRDGTLAALYKRYYYDAYQIAPGAVQIK